MHTELSGKDTEILAYNANELLMEQRNMEERGGGGGGWGGTA